MQKALLEHAIQIRIMAKTHKTRSPAVAKIADHGCQ